MGLFDKNVICSICEEESGLNRYRIADKKWICPGCFKKANFKKIGQMDKPVRKMTVEDVHAAIKTKEDNDNELESFDSTKKIGSFVEFDNNQKKWLVLSSVLGKRNKSTVYNYTDIVDFELLEDGDSVVKGGLGRALVGGALFGGTGAIVGGVTGKRKNKGICNSLKIKVTINDINNPVVYITFLNTATKKDGFVYKNIYKEAHECLSTLQLICDKQESAVENNSISVSSADELLKYKSLLDTGAITQEEYDNKKKQLLEI